jgi:hypothetical protein
LCVEQQHHAIGTVDPEELSDVDDFKAANAVNYLRKRLAFLRIRSHILTMEHVICPRCNTEYDLKVVDATGWRQIPHKTVCEVCGTVLKDWTKDREIILIMTKRGMPV